ncbi:MAG: hypothetical protein ACI4QN_02110 [Candidatus Coproplasma sp.]
MRKNGSRLITVEQYRLTDLFLFAVILVVAELAAHFAVRWLPQEAIYTVSFMVPIVLLVMARWGWQGVFYAIASGLIVCLFNLKSINGVQWASYLIGNAFIALMLLPRYLIGINKIASKWWATALFAVGGWLCVYLGRSIVWAIAYAISPIEGATAASGFVAFATCDVLSLVMAVIVMLIMRKLDGMVEDQKSYLERRYSEKNEKVRRDNYGEELAEIDEEALEILNKENDLFD